MMVRKVHATADHEGIPYLFLSQRKCLDTNHAQPIDYNQTQICDILKS